MLVAGEWATRFGKLLGDVQHPELLFLMALLHDTGKGRSTGQACGGKAGGGWREGCWAG